MPSSIVARSWFVPLSLLLNAACFQYLVARFYHRRREGRVLLLLSLSLLSVASLVPFATQDEDTLSRMNDVSESCLALVLLVQTVLVGSHRRGPGRYKGHRSSHEGRDGERDRDMQRRASIERPQVVPTWQLWRCQPTALLALAADVLIAYDLAVVALGVASVFRPSLSTEFGGATAMNNTAENLTLAFTLLYRFGLRAHEHGWRWVLLHDRSELFWHVVFATHEYVFMLLSFMTGESWERLQAVYMRLTLAPCVWLTVGAHAASHLVLPNAKHKATKQKKEEEKEKPSLQRTLTEATMTVTSLSTNASDASLSKGAMATQTMTTAESDAFAGVADVELREDDVTLRRKFADRLQIFQRGESTDHHHHQQQQSKEQQRQQQLQAQEQQPQLQVNDMN
ncbi:hypothetical protein PINS_up007102 [Pythium insidiosum]|nr:hypothetical protein PINS_up007102 [Pythium insidiosum]